MSAWSRLRAWLSSSDRPDRVTEWLPELHADGGPLDRAEAEIVALRRKVTALQVKERAFEELLAAAHGDGCSCSARCLVVIHDHGTACGGQQHALITAAIITPDIDRLDGHPLVTDVASRTRASRMLNALRGER